jgi:hypothetical protein
MEQKQLNFLYKNSAFLSISFLIFRHFYELSASRRVEFAFRYARVYCFHRAGVSLMVAFPAAGLFSRVVFTVCI